MRLASWQPQVCPTNPPRHYLSDSAANNQITVLQRIVGTDALEGIWNNR